MGTDNEAPPIAVMASMSQCLPLCPTWAWETGWSLMAMSDGASPRALALAKSDGACRERTAPRTAGQHVVRTVTAIVGHACPPLHVGNVRNNGPELAEPIGAEAVV